jgi:hypothetical protein
MKQTTFWEKQQIVMDKERVRFYLANCLAILRGEEGSLNAGQAHSGAWYWRKTNWNEYALVCGRHTHRFNDYGKLYAFCKERGVNAKQA